MESVTYTLSLGGISVVTHMPVRVVCHTARMMMAPAASVVVPNEPDRKLPLGNSLEIGWKSRWGWEGR
jgi:hypothetical protein